jgi:hypothetical protein
VLRNLPAITGETSPGNLSAVELTSCANSSQSSLYSGVLLEICIIFPRFVKQLGKQYPQKLKIVSFHLSVDNFIDFFSCLCHADPHF